MMLPSFQPVIAFSLFYWLIAFCFVVSPTEFQTAGITIQCLFNRWLGSESIDFVTYHIRRTAITTWFHGFIPLGYFIAMTFVMGSGLEFLELSEWAIHVGWQVYFYFAVSVWIGCVTLVCYWHMNKWSNHPIAKTLALYGDSWTAVAAEVNREFRSIDKFTSGPSGVSRVIVTDNWVIQTNAYSVKLAHQDHVTLAIKSTKEYQVSPDTMTTVQYIQLHVHPSKAHSSFLIRILSTDYTDFKSKLKVAVLTLPNLNIHLTSVELFLEVFRDHVMQNPLYITSMSQELGKCIGCDQKTINVKLLKHCANDGDGECENCNCNPLWCVDCMGRWYASRQDQTRPETWLGGSATCPMCRARFCILDVSSLQHA